MESSAQIGSIDFDMYDSAERARIRIFELSGRLMFPGDFSAAVRRGLIKPFRVAGRNIYHRADIEALAKKWGERAV